MSFEYLVTDGLSEGDGQTEPIWTGMLFFPEKKREKPIKLQRQNI